MAHLERTPEWPETRNGGSLRTICRSRGTQVSIVKVAMQGLAAADVVEPGVSESRGHGAGQIGTDVQPRIQGHHGRFVPRFG